MLESSLLAIVRHCFTMLAKANMHNTEPDCVTFLRQNISQPAVCSIQLMICSTFGCRWLLVKENQALGVNSYLIHVHATVLVFGHL